MENRYNNDKPSGENLAQIDEQYSAVLAGAERDFAENPTEESLVVLLAARSNLPKESQPPELLLENIRLVLEHMPSAKMPHVLTFYMGLSFLGLGEPEKARRTFEICLQLHPNYAPAVEILKKIDDLSPSD